MKMVMEKKGGVKTEGKRERKKEGKTREAADKDKRPERS